MCIIFFTQVKVCVKFCLHRLSYLTIPIFFYRLLMTSLYMYKEDLSLNNRQGLICLKTKPNQTKSYIFNIYMYKFDLAKITYNR